ERIELESLRRQLHETTERQVERSTSIEAQLEELELVRQALGDAQATDEIQAELMNRLQSLEQERVRFEQERDDFRRVESELGAMRRELTAARQQLEDNEFRLNGERLALEVQRARMDVDRETVDAEQAALEAARLAIDVDRTELEAALIALGDEQSKFRGERSTFEDKRAALATQESPSRESRNPRMEIGGSPVQERDDDCVGVSNDKTDAAELDALATEPDFAVRVTDQMNSNDCETDPSDPSDPLIETDSAELEERDDASALQPTPAIEQQSPIVSTYSDREQSDGPTFSIKASGLRNLIPETSFDRGVAATKDAARAVNTSEPIHSPIEPPKPKQPQPTRLTVPQMSQPVQIIDVSAPVPEVCMPESHESSADRDKVSIAAASLGRVSTTPIEESIEVETVQSHPAGETVAVRTVDHPTSTDFDSAPVAAKQEPPTIVSVPSVSVLSAPEIPTVSPQASIPPNPVAAHGTADAWPLISSPSRVSADPSLTEQPALIGPATPDSTAVTDPENDPEMPVAENAIQTVVQERIIERVEIRELPADKDNPPQSLPELVIPSDSDVINADQLFPLGCRPLVESGEPSAEQSENEFETSTSPNSVGADLDGANDSTASESGIRAELAEMFGFAFDRSESASDLVQEPTDATLDDAEDEAVQHESLSERDALTVDHFQDIDPPDDGYQLITDMLSSQAANHASDAHPEKATQGDDLHPEHDLNPLSENTASIDLPAYDLLTDAMTHPNAPVASPFATGGTSGLVQSESTSSTTQPSKSRLDFELDDADNVDSMKSYMQQPLQRSRRQTDATVGNPAAKVPPAKTPPVAVETSDADGSAVDEADHEEVDLSAPVARTMQNKDQVRANLDSLRQVANMSARSALASHSWRKLKETMRSKGALTAASAGVATALFASPLWLGLSLTPLALVATAAGGVCGINMIYTAMKARSARMSIDEAPVPKPQTTCPPERPAE
ncbi:MAG: hypothetical protein O3A00_21775, partial [Planctomycetota bacterium]|nr:hypothetical protein [Planctomycetota bacterium]